MAIYDNFPYTNIHEMNLRWVIEQVKQGNLTIEDFAEQLQQFRDDYDTLLALAAAFTIVGSNISTTKNFSAASLSGPLTGNVTGNLTGNVTGNVTGDLTGDVNGGSFQGSYVEATNGQITHNLTVGNDAEIFNNLTVDGIIFGSLTGNASTATSASSATNATNAVNATNASHATTADSATTAGSADSTDTMDIITTLTSTDLNDYVPDSSNHFCIYNTPTIATNYPGLLASNKFTVLAIRSGRGVLQLVFSPPTETDLWFRIRGGSTWSVWKQISTV